MRRFGLRAVVLSSLVASAAFAQGKPASPPPAGKPAPAAAAPTLSPTAAADLKSGNEPKVKAALDDIRMSGKSQAGTFAPIIADLLQKGLTAQLTESAIDTLGDLESESASAVLASYAHHRNPKVRQLAIKALIHTKGPAAIRALRRGLADQDPAVRGYSASGLGTLKAKEAVPDLLTALDHRIAEAAAAIGQLCAGQECDQLAARLGRLPFDVVTGGIEQLLFRTGADVTDDTKVKAINHLRELGTAESGKFLRDVQKRLGTTGSPKVKQAVDSAVASTGGGA